MRRIAILVLCTGLLGVASCGDDGPSTDEEFDRLEQRLEELCGPGSLADETESFDAECEELREELEDLGRDAT